MATNNPYTRSFKTKREQYEEKLKQRNENENWIFGNTFGRPGGGAPLRDKNGNVVSNLKSITNGNIYKYEAQDFSKGDNNISVVNHKIFERNNGDVNNVISDPFTPFRNYITQFESNQNNNANIPTNNNNIIQNINTINPNQIILSQEQLNNLNYQNNLNNPNNQNIQLDEEQKKQLYLDQFRQNPYLVQVPYGIITQYPMVHPFIPLDISQVQNQNPNLIQNNLNNNTLNNNNYNNQIEYQRPYTTNNVNINTNNINDTNTNNVSNVNNNINNYSNISNINNTNNNYSDITGNNNGRRKYIRKLPESTLFSDIDQEKIKLEEKEKKMNEWKKELLVQMNEKKKREAEEKRRMREKEKKDELNNEKYMKYKKKQREEQKKMHMKMINNQLQNEVDGSGSMGNLLDISNDLEQVNKSMHSQNNLLLKDIANNDLSQNNIQIQDNMNNNNNFNNNNNIYNNNFNPVYPSQEEQNFKSYIDRQYHLLNDTLNHDINNEMKRIEEEVEYNYTPFTKKFLLMNTNSKTTAEFSLENEKKLKKIQDLIEERKLDDYILGKRERPPTPKKENEELENIDLSVPSYFGINRDKAENKYLGLHSKSSFITKNDNIASFIASGRNQNLNNNVTSDLIEKEQINDNYNKILNDELDINSNFYPKANTIKATFGTNIKNDEALGGSINLAKNLDNISEFILLNNNRENINLTNEQKIKFVPGLNSDFGKYKDKDMDDLFKDLDKIYELTNKIDVTSKARNISDKFENDLNRKKNLNKEQIDNISLNSKNNENNIVQDKISEEKSNNSNIQNGTNSKFSENILTNGKYSQNSKNSNNVDSNLDNENKNENENGSNKEYSSNIEKNSNSQKEENELNNEQNFNEEPNQNENIGENQIQNNVNNIEQGNNEPENIQNNNENENQNEEREEYEYVDDEEEEVEQE